MKKYIALLMVLVLVVGMVSGCNSAESGNDTANGSDQEAVVWKVAYEEIEGGIQDAYAKKFEELIEEKFEGRVDVELYPAGQLGFGSAQIELLKVGGVDFMLNYAAAVATTIPETQVLSMNFLFPDDDVVNGKVLTEGKAIKKMDELFLANDMKSLHWFNMGFMNWTSNKPLNTVEDFEGLKMRVMASPVSIANYKALNANPTPVPFMEVYSGLQLKMIDAQENPTATIQEMKFYEVQDYLTISRHGLMAGNLVANVDFWNNISDEDKALFNSILPELSEHVVSVQGSLTDERLQIIKDAGDTEIVILSEDERAVLSEASLPVRDVFIEETGDSGSEILNLLLEDINSFTN